MKLEQAYYAPFAYSQYSLTKKNIIVLIALSLQIILLFFAKDFAAILNMFICVGAVILSNVLAQLINRSKNYFHISLLTEGLLIAFCTPVSYHPFSLFVLVLLAQIIVKHFFSGYGGNIFSTIACTVMLLYLSYPAYFPENLNNIQLLKTHGTMLSTLQIKGMIQNDKDITSLLNYFFANIGVVIPEGYATLLSNSVSRIPAFRYNLVTLFSSAFLFAFDIGEKLISFVYVFVYGMLVWIFGMYRVDGSFFTGDILSAFCTTGLFFYAFFIVGESSTVPNSHVGKIIFASILGILTFALCGTGGNPVGIALAIIAANFLVPLIIHVENYVLIANLRKRYGCAK